MSGPLIPDREQMAREAAASVRPGSAWAKRVLAGHRDDDDAVRAARAALAFASQPRPASEQALGYVQMGSGGRCDFDQLREAVSEATVGTRDCPQFNPDYYPGHQMVAGINYNSLDRIVTAFVDAAQREQEGWREAIGSHETHAFVKARFDQEMKRAIDGGFNVPTDRLATVALEAIFAALMPLPSAPEGTGL